MVFRSPQITPWGWSRELLLWVCVSWWWHSSVLGDTCSICSFSQSTFCLSCGILMNCHICCRGGSGMVWFHSFLPGATVGLWELKHKHTLFPELIAQLGPPIFLPLNGSLYKTKGCGPAGLFCTKCLSMGDFRLSSQFKTLYVYIASMVKFLGGYFLAPPFLSV